MDRPIPRYPTLAPRAITLPNVDSARGPTTHPSLVSGPDLLVMGGANGYGEGLVNCTYTVVLGNLATAVIVGVTRLNQSERYHVNIAI